MAQVYHFSFILADLPDVYHYRRKMLIFRKRRKSLRQPRRWLPLCQPRLPFPQ